MSLVRHLGACHCGAVKFAVEAPADLEVYECNCSICASVGYLHLIVPADRFHLLSGRERLSSYRFNTGVANHLFCGTCGVKSFYVPRSHPDGYSVNARCLGREKITGIRVVPFDGANWESNVAKLPTA